MSSSPSSLVVHHPRAAAVSILGEQLRIVLTDQRELLVPVAWFEFLARAGHEERAGVRIIGDGIGLWWEALGDGVSVPLLFGLSEDA